MSITRYNHDPCTSFDGRMMPHPNGRYVLHYDHAMDKADAAEDYANLLRQLNSQHMLAQKILLDSVVALDAMESSEEKAEAVVELGLQLASCAKKMNETFDEYPPVKAIEIFMRQNAAYMAAMHDMYAAFKQPKGTQ